MNTKIKTFLMALVLLPATLIFAACGGPLDSKASVNVSGNYNQESSVEDLQAYVNDATTDAESIQNGFKLSLDLAMDVDGQKVTFNLNSIMKMNETTCEMYTKLTGKSGKESLSMTFYMIGEKSETSEITGTVYADINMGSEMNGKYKFSIKDFESRPDLYGVVAGLTAVTEEFSLDNIKNLESSLSGDKAIMKSVTDNSTKFKVTLSSGDDKTADLYYVFENNKWVGFQINNYTYTDNSMGVITVNCSMCTFTDEINFDTNGYTDFTMPTA